jgi:hypothetical protein
VAPRHLPASSSARSSSTRSTSARRASTHDAGRDAGRAPARTRAVPTPATPAGTRTGRAGFVLYVGLNGEDPGARLADLAEVAESLRDLARDLLPTAETYTALSLVPGTGQDDVRDLRDRLQRLQPLEPAPTSEVTPVAETA